MDDMDSLDSIFFKLSQVTPDTILLLSIEESMEEHPSLMFSFYGRSSLITMAKVDLPKVDLEDI